MTTVLGRSAIGQWRPALAAIAVMAGLSTAAMAQGQSTQPGADGFTPRLELMLRTMRIARDWHVNRPGKPELVAGAIQGLLQKVDPEAELYSRSDLRRLGAGVESSRGHLGLELRREPPVRRQASRGYRVVSSRDGSPAAQAGLKAGDLITHFGGRPAGEIASLAVRQGEIAGALGSSIRLTLERDAAADAIDLDLDRTASVAPPAIVAEAAPGIIGVRIAAIEARMSVQVEREVGALRERLGTQLRGIVLDLRATAGGDLAEATALADIFLEQGVILVVQARGERDNARHVAAGGDVATGRPLVVLIDGGTAGAAEVLAAALQDNKRARLVGVRSAGRGTVRGLRNLGRKGEKGALLMATSRLLTPTGKPIEGKGLTPDVVAEQAPADPACRSLDISQKGQPGRCIRRGAAEDGQFERGLGLLDDQVAAGAQATPPRH